MIQKSNFKSLINNDWILSENIWGKSVRNSIYRTYIAYIWVDVRPDIRTFKGLYRTISAVEWILSSIHVYASFKSRRIKNTSNHTACKSWPFTWSGRGERHTYLKTYISIHISHFYVNLTWIQFWVRLMFEFTFITALNIVILMWQFGYNIVTVTTYQFNQVRISFRHIRLPLVKLQSGEGSYSQILRSFAQIDVDLDVSYLAHFLI